MNPINLFSSSKFESKEVIDSIGYEYGKIKDIIFDPLKQKVLMVVIANSDYKNGYFVLPWSVIRINPNTHTCMMEINKETIKKAPEISYDELLKGEKETLLKIYTYYGVPGYGEQSNKNMESIETSEPLKNRHNSAMGSESATKNVPAEESKLSNEMDFDKLTGKSEK